MPCLQRMISTAAEPEQNEGNSLCGEDTKGARLRANGGLAASRAVEYAHTRAYQPVDSASR